MLLSIKPKLHINFRNVINCLKKQRAPKERERERERNFSFICRKNIFMNKNREKKSL